MKNTFLNRFHFLFLSFILISSLPLAAMFKDIDEYTARDLAQDDYIFLNNESYNISDFIFTVSEFDNDFESPLHVLKKYILNGFLIGLKDEVLQVLGYAEWLLEKENIIIDNKQRKQLLMMVDNLVEAIASEKLIVDFNNQYKKLPLKVINKRLHVKGKTRLFSDFIVEGKSRFHKPVRFYKRVHLKDGIRVDGIASLQDVVIENCINDLCVQNISIVDGSISGTLSVQDLAVQTIEVPVGGLTISDVTIDNLTVTNCVSDLCLENVSIIDGSISGTLSVEDLVAQTLTGSDMTVDNLTVMNCVSNLCLETASLVDATVSGTLSVNDLVLQTLEIFDLIITNVTFGTASITDAVIDNLTVTNCVSDLCVENLSVVDGSVSGILSINDVVIESLTPAGVVHTDAFGNLSSSLIVNADVDPAAGIVDTKLATISTAGKVANSATTATSANTPNTIVLRNGSGNFTTNMITITGTVTNPTDVATKAYVDSSISAIGTNLNTPNTLVKRDNTGSFAAQTISLVDEVATGSITVTPFGTAGVVHNNASGLLSSSLIVNADVAPAAGIVDTKLATISTAGKVANSATTATSANTPNTIVLRDNTGSFSAQTISLVDEVISGNISMNDSTSAAVGNIVKAGNRFIHNFGTNNTFVGVNAGNFTLTGISNTGVGVGALTSLTTGTNNVALGNNALAANTTGVNNIAIGVDALTANTIGASNIAIGTSALDSNTTGVNNVAIGINSLSANTTGIRNIAVGNNTLQSNTGGQVNIAIGHQALSANTIGVNNVAVGDSALFTNTTGFGNTGIGSSALSSNTTGHENTAVGLDALSANTTGVRNTAVGANSLEVNTIGSDNTTVGEDSLIANTTGNQNTALGRLAGPVVTTGSNNVLVGYNVGGSLTTGDNNIYIDGNSLNPTNESNTIRIGNTQTACYIQGISGATTGLAGVTVLVDANGQLGTISSSRKFKYDIQDLNEASENIYKLRPVSFVYNSDQTKTTQFGLIAEEVDKVFPTLVVRDKSGSVYTVRYEILPVLLLNEMQKQKVNSDQQREDINLLKKVVAQLQEKVQKFLHS